MIVYDVSTKKISSAADKQEELTPDEQEAMQQKNQSPDERLSKVEQRTADLESNSAEMLEALDMLLSGVTE